MAYVGIGRLLIQLAEAVAPALLAYYEAEQRQTAPTPFGWKKVQARIYREDGEDVCTNTFDIVNITSGAVDPTWTTADYVTVETRLNTFYNAVKSMMAPWDGKLEYRWYDRPIVPGADMPASRVTTGIADLNPVGDGLPPQLAMTITKVVASRRHWGRIYLGPLNMACIDNLGATGRFKTDHVEQAATAFEALRAGLQADDFPMVVADRLNTVLMTVEGTRVDNIADVQRRRRPRANPATIVHP